MHFFIDHFETVMSSFNNPTNCIYKAQFEDQKRNIDKIDLQELYQKIRKELLKLSISHSRPKVIRNHIQAYQNYCTDALIQLEHNTHRCAYKEECFTHNILPQINFHIKLLNFLISQFPEHFNKEQIAPPQYCAKYKEEFSKKIKEILTIDISRNQILAIKQVVSEFNDHESTRCSFEKIWYLEKILSHVVVKIDKNKGKGNQFFQLIEVVISLNFNSNGVYNAIVNGIKWHISRMTQTKEKINKLKHFRKLISQTMLIDEVGFDANAPKVKDLVIDWIKKELNSFKYSYHISADKPIESNIKFKTTLSAAQSAKLFKHLVDQKILIPENKKATFRIVSGALSTENEESLTPGSFRSKYYSKDIVTAEEVKKILLNLYKSFEIV